MGLRNRLNTWKEQKHQRGFQSSQQLRIASYLSGHPVRKLQIGCGFNLLDGWLNTDLQNYDDSVVFLDVTKPFPMENDTFEFVFSEHVIQHLSYNQGSFMLSEIFRVLRPGGKIRIAVPNIRFLLDLYSEQKSAIQEQYLSWFVDRFLPGVREHREVFVINHFFRAWGHQFLYDPPTLFESLLRQGFRNASQHEPGSSSIAAFRGLEKHGQIIGEEFNRLETFVLEAEKPLQ